MYIKIISVYNIYKVFTIKFFICFKFYDKFVSLIIKLNSLPQNLKIYL